MDAELEKEKKLSMISKMMGNDLRIICDTMEIDRELFCHHLADELKFKQSKRAKPSSRTVETTLGYIEFGVPKKYLLKEFRTFYYAVVKAIKKCIENNPHKQQEWDRMQIGCRALLIIDFDCARQLEFVKNKGKNPMRDPKILLLEFAYGNFPEEYQGYPGVDSLAINQVQADMMRKQLLPNIKTFLKDALGDNEFLKNSAYIVGFCLGIWPEQVSEQVVLDGEHKKTLRFALRQYGEWLLTHLSNSLPETPKLPEVNSWQEKLEFELFLSEHTNRRLMRLDNAVNDTDPDSTTG